MPFLLSNMFLDKYKTLQQDYEKRTGVNLSTQAAPSAVSKFFGAHDTSSRKNQFSMLASVYNELKTHLEGNAQKCANEAQQWQAYVIALRILLVTTLYVKSQVAESFKIKNPTSVLLTLIDEALGITSQNSLDINTKKLCLDSAEKWLNFGLQAELDPLFAKSFSYLEEKELSEFKAFVKAESLALSAIQPTDYPIASTISPLFRAPFALAGSQIGSILGAALAEKNTFASTLIISSLSRNSFVISLMPGAYVGAVVLIPAITARLLSSFYGVSLSWAMGSGLGLVGEGVGFGVGMSLDLSVMALKNACKTLGEIIYKQEQNTLPSGLRLSDGHMIQYGIDLQAIEAITFTKEKPSAALLLQPATSEIKIEVLDSDEESWVLASPGKACAL